MRRYRFDAFGLDRLRLEEIESTPPGPGEVQLRVRAMSLNYRDLLVLKGVYNPRLELPATPVSDGAGEIVAVGDGVSDVSPGDRVMTHFFYDWLDGPYRGRYLRATVGTPGPGLAAEVVNLPARAVVTAPSRMSWEEAATLPIAGLTAWSALVTEGALRARQTVLTLGTGGVSIFALQIAHAMGARVIVTSSSDEKLERCRALGADVTVNYRTEKRWDRAVLDATGGEGVDVVVETGGIETLGRSFRATRPGGVVALMGALTGMVGEVDISHLVMKRQRVAGVLVDSRAAFFDFVSFLERHGIAPVIGARFPFDRLRDALLHMESGAHFGKIVVEGA